MTPLLGRFGFGEAPTSAIVFASRRISSGDRTVESYPLPMPDRIRVACVQMTSRTDKAANLATAERLVAQAASTGADVVVLPEKWNTIGDAAIYRKIHLFDVEVGGFIYRESEAEEPGEEAVVARLEGWGIGLSVCYDVRFPELYRILALEGALLLTVPAHFTLHTGKDHWEVLLRARAIENQCYVAAAAQIGQTLADKPPSYGRSLI